MVGVVTDDVDTVIWKRWARTEISSPARRTGEAVPLPRQSRNSTGRHSGCEQNGTVTMMPAMIHRLPRPSALGSCAEPSWVQNAANTMRPHRIRSYVRSSRRCFAR